MYVGTHREEDKTDVHLSLCHIHSHFSVHLRTGGSSCWTEALSFCCLALLQLTCSVWHVWHCSVEIFINLLGKLVVLT